MKGKQKIRNTGIPGIKAPERTCSDSNCPFHGKLGIRGRLFQGVLIHKKTATTGTVEWFSGLYSPKYERFEKKKRRVKVHIPECLDVEKGDSVLIGECRPMSKTKTFVLLNKIEVKK